MDPNGEERRHFDDLCDIVENSLNRWKKLGLHNLVLEFKRLVDEIAEKK